ncbi:MAG: M42 family metallopeptidase [Ruminococcaceae bacterium]|nr:M42 family metallopeptidase [Oscillospiraceae bacterium]
MELKSLLKELTDSVYIGSIDSARKTIGRYLDFCKTEKIGANSFCATLSGKTDKTLIIDAHIDEVGMVVTNVSDNGFVTVSNVGGIDLRQLPTKEVIIHGKKDVTGVFISTPPHLAKDGRSCTEEIGKIKIDTANKNAKNIINVGNFVTYKNSFLSLGENKICAKALDNRAGCAVLVLTANLLRDRELPFNVKFLFSDSEELGLRGAKTAVFDADADAAIVIDVSFGNAPDVPSDKSGKLGKGSMIGISPVLNKAITEKLISTAESNKIDYQKEVMGSSTGTNADVISVTKCGVPTALVSIPLRNMHTDSEVINIRDIENTVQLLYKFIISGGAL